MRRLLTLLAVLALSVTAPCGCGHFQKKKDKDKDDSGSGFDPRFKEVGVGSPSRMPTGQR